MSLRFIYISRQFNRSGYYILKELLETGNHPELVLLPPVNANPELDDAEKAKALKKDYLKKCKSQNIQPLRFMESIKLLAESYKVPVHMRESLKRKEDFGWMKDADPELVVLGGGWPELIPERIIEIPPLGVLNTHPSLLPDFRGTDIHRWQVLHGVEQSGATIHYIDETFDTGGILAQRAVDIHPADTPQELFEKTARLSGKLMVEVLGEIEKARPQKLESKVQADRKNTSRYYSRWKWEDPAFLKLDFRESARTVYFKILANTQEDYKFNGAWASLNRVKYIIRKAQPIFDSCGLEPGVIAAVGENGMDICCGDGRAIRVTQMQPATVKGYPEEPNYGRIINAEELKSTRSFAENTKFD